jgi:CheY-like chemotaxis protein
LKTILIIDDDTDMVDAMKIVLESGGYKVLSAPNSVVGLKLLTESNPDLLILDVMMETDTEGFEVAWQIRSEDPASAYAAFRKMPILMITNVGNEKHMKFDPKKDSDFLPVDDFITKPVKPVDLLDKVGKYLI